MFGPTLEASTSLQLGPNSGIVPRVCDEIMTALAVRRACGLEVSLRVTYVEIYADEVFNLLQAGETVGAWRGVAARAVAGGQAEVEVHTRDELQALLLAGEKAKRRAATAMNERSSRAHSLLFFTLEQHNRETDVKLRSRMCLADLGGSEQVKKSKATGERLQEAVNINMGLLALKNCIKAMHRNKDHVPFLDSLLTMLLQDTLAGNSRSLVVVTGSMDALHVTETMAAMRFGAVCRRIENEGGLDAVTGNSVLEALDAEIAQMEERIQKEERWETRMVERDDLDGKERMLVTVPGLYHRLALPVLHHCLYTNTDFYTNTDLFTQLELSIFENDMRGCWRLVTSLVVRQRSNPE